MHVDDALLQMKVKHKKAARMVHEVPAMTRNMLFSHAHTSRQLSGLVHGDNALLQMKTKHTRSLPRWCMT